MRLNGKAFSINDLKKIAGYVMQDDLLNVNLTGAYRPPPHPIG